MGVQIREYTSEDVPEMIRIWNDVVEDGIAFPQEDALTPESGTAFFGAQTYCGVAQDASSGTVCGLYILHPNNVGRCGHISNVSYAVQKDFRGQHIGEKLVLDSIGQARAHSFGIIQLNAVVASNASARHLYERIGFIPLGMIPNGFRMKDGSYESICPYYYEL